MGTSIRVLLLAAGIVLISTPAFAYLDPGTGSMMLQIVVGTIAAVLVSIRSFWRNIRNIFASLFGNRPNADPDR